MLYLTRWDWTEVPNRTPNTVAFTVPPLIRWNSLQWEHLSSRSPTSQTADCTSSGEFNQISMSPQMRNTWWERLWKPQSRNIKDERFESVHIMFAFKRADFTQKLHVVFALQQVLCWQIWFVVTTVFVVVPPGFTLGTLLCSLTVKSSIMATVSVWATICLRYCACMKWTGL